MTPASVDVVVVVCLFYRWDFPVPVNGIVMRTERLLQTASVETVSGNSVSRELGVQTAVVSSLQASLPSLNKLSGIRFV